MPKTPSANLSIVASQAPGSYPEPPGKLGAVGRALWDGVVQSYEFADPASTEILFQACAGADRAAACREAIDADGEVIRSKAGIRDHPALKHELANRAFVVRSLARLGLDLEPVRGGPGRPPGR